MRNYQRTKTNAAIAIVTPIVVDVGKTTIVGVAANQTVIILEYMPSPL